MENHVILLVLLCHVATSSKQAFHEMRICKLTGAAFDEQLPQPQSRSALPQKTYGISAYDLLTPPPAPPPVPPPGNTYSTGQDAQPAYSPGLGRQYVFSVTF
jgi:hypothetical protein